MKELNNSTLLCVIKKILQLIKLIKNYKMLILLVKFFKKILFHLKFIILYELIFIKYIIKYLKKPGSENKLYINWHEDKRSRQSNLK